jgi:phospholipid transport system substrate-binding protein
MKHFKDKNTSRYLISLLVFVFVTLLTVNGKAEQQEPSDIIKKFNATLMESMQNADKLGYSGRYKILEPVIKDSFALHFMATISLGRYWKNLTEKEKNLFLETYTDWTIASYAGQFNNYSGESFEVTSESKSIKDIVTVISKLIQPKEEEVDFYYQLRKIGGKWQIVDIQISGVSQLALTRSQFVSEIKKKGFDALISTLKNKSNYKILRSIICIDTVFADRLCSYRSAVFRIKRYGKNRRRSVCRK